MPAVTAGLLAAIPWGGLRPSLLQSIVIGGLVVLTGLLIVLMSTRWGQSRPVAKCAVLSLIAHLLLLFYAYGTQVLFGPPASQYGTQPQRFAHVRIDSAEDWPEDAAEVTDPTAAAEEPPPNVPAENVAVEPPPTPPAENQAPTLLVNAPKPRVAEEPAPAEPGAETIAAAEPMPAASASPATSPTAAEATSPAAPATAFAATIVRAVRPGDGKPVPESLATRATENRASLLSQYGGNPDTERSVQLALDWLTKNQSPDGRWEAARFGAGKETRTLGHDRGGAGGKADTGITGLAILALLGSGETHLEGTRRTSVQHGLEFLLSQQALDGNLAGQAEFFAAMYCHSISLLALSEAYALTGDARLKDVVQRGVNFSLRAQGSDGGWRYRPLDTGDMSQFGWQVMALKSAKAGGIEVPPDTFTRMAGFLHKCSIGPGRGLGTYRPGDRPSRSMTAEALACRYFLASSNSAEALREAAGYVREELPGPRTNFYYWYYGTVAMFQRGGDDWKEWNTALQATLLDGQRVDGELNGSWDPDPLWGGYGGRVFSTALGALCLESYYRYLPLMLSDEERELRLTTRPGGATR